MSAISKADVLETFADLYDVFEDNKAIRKELDKVYDRLNALPSAQSEQHWISCSERLPEDDTEVFVYLFDRQSPYIAWVCDGCWFTEEFQVEKENYPKAWCELPEPYREEGEKNDYLRISGNREVDDGKVF